MFYNNIESMWHGWSASDAEIVNIWLDSYSEREQNTLITEGKEVTEWNKVQNIASTGHCNDLIQYRIHTATLGCVRSTDSAMVARLKEIE
jgi:hypothetical protein